MSELSTLISRLQTGIRKNASYLSTIRHPRLLVASLRELNGLIGNDKVKDSVATQVSHLIMIKRRALENPHIKEDDVMLNTVLYGPPGVGKTLIGSKLAKIWYSLGYLDGSRNAQERRGQIGEAIKDMLKDSGASSGSDDTTLLLYIMFVFIMILVTVLSMTWSFYSRFGGWLTVLVIVILLITIIAVGYYLNSILNENDTTSDNLDQVRNTNEDKPAPIRDEAPLENPLLDEGEGEGEERAPPMYMPSDEQVIKVVTRADFVDRYVGWSDKKTLKLLNENLGKVLFVDEAYSLVTDVHDSFGMEVLTTINLFLSQHSREIIVIFGGYKDLMDNGIFSFQPGLKRRFMWQFDCSGYNEEQMFEIFRLQLRKKGWGLTDIDGTKQLFKIHKGCFPAFGGDTERLTFFAELEHSRDFLRSERGIEINRLTPEHVRKGIAKLQENTISSQPGETSSNPLVNMMKLLQGQNKEDDMTEMMKSLSHARR